MPVQSRTLYQIDARLRSACRAPLPGGDAHRRLAPQPRPGWRPGEVPDHATPAAALVLLYAIDDVPHVLLTVRSGRLGKHAGQVSFPGGLLDAGESIREAALREAFEEVGLEPAAVRVVGALSPLYITVSNYAIHPVAGIAETAPPLRAAAAEVARLLPGAGGRSREPLQSAARHALARRSPLRRAVLRGPERAGLGGHGDGAGELLAMLDLGPRNPW